MLKKREQEPLPDEGAGEAPCVGDLVDVHQPLEQGRGEHGPAPDLVGTVDLGATLEGGLLKSNPLDGAVQRGHQVAQDAALADHQGQAGAGALQPEAADHA